MRTIQTELTPTLKRIIERVFIGFDIDMIPSITLYG